VKFLYKKVKVAVIGTGQIATIARIPAYLSNKDVDLVALVDVDVKKAKRAARKFGVRKFFASVDELFEKQNVDAVSICTPPSTHADLTLKAFEYGAHVLCEKPMANNVKSGKRMLETSKAKKKILMVSSYRRFVPNYQRAKKRILKGALGHVYCIEDIQLSSSPLLTWGKSPWYYNPKGGGVLIDLGPHCFDLLNYLFGDFPVAVSAHSFVYLDSPVEECCVCTLEYPENRIGVGTMSWLSSTGIENTSIHGTVETIYVSPKFFLEINRIDVPEISLWREITLRLIRLKLSNLPKLRKRKNVDPLQLETNHFIEQIKHNRISSLNTLNALNVLITIDAAKKALQENRRTKISSLKQV
jgi:UDP-N-acetylglucosamine 3-dehydrogenase